MESVRPLDQDAPFGSAGQIGEEVFVICELFPVGSFYQEILRRLGRTLALDDEAAGIDIDDSGDAFIDVVVVAFIEARLFAGLDRHLVDERLRADLFGVLVIHDALIEDVALIG